MRDELLVGAGTHQFRGHVHGVRGGFGVAKAVGGGDDTGEEGGSFGILEGFVGDCEKKAGYHFGD